MTFPRKTKISINVSGLYSFYSHSFFLSFYLFQTDQFSIVFAFFIDTNWDHKVTPHFFSSLQWYLLSGVVTKFSSLCFKLLNFPWLKGKSLTFMIPLLSFILSISFHWEDISNTLGSVWPHFQAPQSSSKIHHSASYFQLSSRCLEMLSNMFFRR